MSENIKTSDNTTQLPEVCNDCLHNGICKYMDQVQELIECVTDVNTYDFITLTVGCKHKRFGTLIRETTPSYNYDSRTPKYEPYAGGAGNIDDYKPITTIKEPEESTHIGTPFVKDETTGDIINAQSVVYTTANNSLPRIDELTPPSVKVVSEQSASKIMDDTMLEAERLRRSLNAKHPELARDMVPVLTKEIAEQELNRMGADLTPMDLSTSSIVGETLEDMVVEDDSGSFKSIKTVVRTVGE